MFLLLPACGPDDPTPVAVSTGDGLFRQGCPVEGESRARILDDPAERPWGEEGLAGPGDALLLNEHAAFVIQGPDDPDTYYQYGGAPIDAVAVDGCDQAGPELLEELGFIVGQLDLSDFVASSLHQIRGETIDVVADGSDGGPAIVEVHGTDDRFWLVELTLVRQAWTDGGRKELGELFGLDVTLRYTLAPDSPVLQMDVLLDGEVAEGFLVGAVVFPSDLLSVNHFHDDELSLGGFSLDLGVPWLSMGGADGSLAVAMPEADMATTSVAGVRALLDLNHMATPVTLEPTPFLLGVGATDASSASATLEPWLDRAWSDVEGSVGVAGATVTLYEGGTTWIDAFVADADGDWSGRTIAGDWTAIASADGRDSGEALGPEGAITFDLDGPARVELVRDDGASTVLYALPGETLPVAPGTWTAWISRGYEYSIVESEVTVDGTATVSATLEHLLDTEGWVSIDTHVHASASADSATLNGDRFRTAAAAGLDVMVSTDHEAILDYSEDAVGSVAYGLGSEVTATVPEHVNAWPFPVTDDDRGDPVRWYQLGFPDLYAAIRDRGARVIQLNHSRVNGECGILCVLDWDRVSEPVTDDPEGLGLPAGTEIWSWDFDSFEVINGLRSPLLDVRDPRHSGALVDWLAFHNLGHPVTGVAVTDVHGLDIPGSPRTFVRGEATAEDAADAELGGHAVMSAGAFADVSIDGAGPGDLATGSALAITVQALPEIDVTRVYVLVDCDLAQTLDTTDPAGIVKLDTEVSLSLVADAHVVVLGFGSSPMPRGLEDYDPATVPRFITNPIFVDHDGDGAWTPPGAKECATGVEIGG